MTRYDFKGALLECVFQALGPYPAAVLDLGSGTSKDFPDVLRRFPNVAYTGLEFDQRRQRIARELLADVPNATLASGFGEGMPKSWEGTFDVTLSLSVLEHVKNLREFLHASVAATRPGGLILHRYDLGHSLHSGLYERIKVMLCTRAGPLMPARHFTCHPDKDHVIELLEASGATVCHVFYSQTQSLKRIVNTIDWQDDEQARLGRQIVDLDRSLAEHCVQQLDARQMEFLFPAVTIVAVRGSTSGAGAHDVRRSEAVIEALKRGGQQHAPH